MRKLPLIALAILSTVACSHKKNVNQDIVSDFEAETQEIITAASNGSLPQNRLPQQTTPWANHIGVYDEIFNDSNHYQYEWAERLGINPISTLFDAYNTTRPLIKIESGENYQLDRLTHSMPYLVPEAASLLEEIGEDFGRLIEERGGDKANNRIIVTSLLRSHYTVRKLRRVNRNAVDSSTHMFGTTFDIAWNNFHYPDSSAAINAGILKGILAEVLLKKREEGKCMVKYEKKTPCFHITVTKGAQ